MSKNSKIDSVPNNPSSSELGSELTMSSSEPSCSDFRSRLERVIGKEKPFAWANRIGVPRSTFSRMWNDGVAPKAETLLAVSVATGLSIDWLLTGEGPMRRGETAATIQPASTVPVEPSVKAAVRAGDFHLSMGDSMELLVNIHKSGNNVLIRAINANLMAFNEAIENRERAETTYNAIHEMKDRLNMVEGEVIKLRQENLALHQKLLSKEDRGQEEAAG